MITVEAFDKIDVRAGTVIDVKPNKKSRNPAYVVSIDFGEELGVKKSSAQITALYQPEDLVGKQVICCVNLAPMHIGSVKSEVRILGTDSAQGVVLLRPTETVKNGDRKDPGRAQSHHCRRGACQAGNHRVLRKEYHRRRFRSQRAHLCDAEGR